MASQPTETVLIIDDDDAKRHAIAKILRKAGYAIRESENATEGLRLAAEKPTLIILDVKLPDLSGFEVCRRIKENPATSTIPVLHISTTFVDLEDRIHGLEGGADAYLTDVLEPLELIATVKALLRARRAEEAAQISTRQWQVTFDAINDGVVLLDHTGQVIQSNAAMENFLSISRDSLCGQSIHHLVSLPLIPEDSPFLRMLHTGHREAVELTSGDRWFRVTFDPIRDSEGVVKGGVCIASEITDRRKMEEELRRRAMELALADKRKDELLAMLAHELRNPLAPITNALEAIRLDRSDPATTEEALAIAMRQVRHMARLLDDLLDVSRFTKGIVQLRKIDVDLTSVLEQAVETSRPLIEAGGHKLSASLPTGPVWLKGDPTRLAQVVANLLNNAAKYTDRGGQIALRADQEGDELVVRVRDNGVGLSADMLPRVFDLFSQEDRSLDRSQGGLGIGLTLARSLVELHEGTIRADSSGPGLGSEFTIRLPALPHTRSTSSIKEGAPPTTQTQPEALRILVVDDSQDSARSLARVLRLWGHETRVAHEGPVAIELTLAESFDVIILDIGLPDMNGYQVAAQLRAHFGSLGPVLIALTGYGQEEDVFRSRTAGFDEHLVKPVSLDQLRALLSDAKHFTGREGRNESTRGVGNGCSIG
jgi:PAS domain S-box-containing protein